jgi:hypothetical protein
MQVVVLCVKVDGTTQASVASSHNVGGETAKGLSNILSGQAHIP